MVLLLVYLGLAGCVVVFRTSRGFVKGCFANLLGIAFAFEAELAAAIHAIRLAREKGWHSIWLESDSTYLVALLHSRSSLVPW